MSTVTINPRERSIRDLKARIHTLENELLRRPQIGDIEYVRERIARRERMYEVVLARNEILKRRLDESQARVLELERQIRGAI